MPTSTYTPLANLTLSTGQSSVSFTSISGAYRDLVLTFNGSLPSGQGLYLRLNGASTNHSIQRIYNSGGGTPSADTLSDWEIAFTNTTIFSKTDLLDYTATDKNKVGLTRWGNADGTSYTMAMSGKWASTAAITNFSLVTSGGGNITAGSTFALYGVIS